MRARGKSPFGWNRPSSPSSARRASMSKGDGLLSAVLLLFGFACVGCEVFGAYEFMWAKFQEWNYLVIGVMLVTALTGVLPLAAERARRNRQYGKMVACWMAIPLALAFV